MAVSSSESVDAEEIFELLLLDIERPIDLVKDILSEDNVANTEYRNVNFPESLPQLNSNTNDEENQHSWGKSLAFLPQFTIKELEQHRLNSGKTPDSAIIKTLDRGRKFKNERYLSSDSIFTKWDGNNFHVKCQCKASMKKEKRDVLVALDRSAGNVLSAKCTCPAGQSGYCNHVMALLLEIADYSLNQLECVPEEISCTSQLRQWGVPGESSNKAPVMDTVVQRQTTSRGISSTLFDPRKYKALPTDRLLTMQNKLCLKIKKLGFLVVFHH